MDYLVAYSTKLCGPFLYIFHESEAKDKNLQEYKNLTFNANA